jgi:hypothetical protein
VHGLRPHEEQPISPGLGRSVFPTRKKGCLVVFSLVGHCREPLIGPGHFFVVRGILEFIRKWEGLPKKMRILRKIAVQLNSLSYVGRFKGRTEKEKTMYQG